MLQLSRKDVANLRLSSIYWRQLPQLYFHHLVLTEMPWLWEILSIASKDMDWHALWLRLSASDGANNLDQEERGFAPAYREQVSATIREELKGHPDFHNELHARLPGVVKMTEERVEAEKRSGRWEVKGRVSEIKGLRNRRRIWEDVEEILRRIGELPNEEDWEA